MPEITGGSSYADELAQYQRLQQKFSGGDRGKADAEDLEAFKKLQARMGAGGVAPDTKAGKMESSGSTATIPLDSAKPAEAAKVEPPPQPKKKKKNCLQKIGDALGKVAGFIGKAVPVVAKLMDAFKAFSAAKDDDKEKKADAVFDAAKDVKKAADQGDEQSKKLYDAYKELDKADRQKPPDVIQV